MSWLTVHPVYHSVLFRPHSTRPSQPCSLSESCLAILKCFSRLCVWSLYDLEARDVWSTETTIKIKRTKERKREKQKSSSSLQFSLLNCKLESNLGDVFCFPRRSSRTQVSSSLKGAQCCSAKRKKQNNLTHWRLVFP